MYRLSFHALLLLTIWIFRIQQAISDTVACGANRPRVLSNFTGRFTSPNYPESYANNLNCTWLVTSEEQNATVMIEFTVIRLEGNTIDDVAVYDGNSLSSPELARFTGIYNISPDAIISTGHQLFVQLYTSPSDNETGFEAQYTFDTACLQPRDLPELTGSFSSLYHPYTYTKDKICQWNMRLEPFQVADLRFELFKVGVLEQTCPTDYLEVILANGTSRRFCGQQTPPTSLRQSANFRFVSHPTNTPAAGSGFFVYYEIHNTSEASVTISTNPDSTTKPVIQNITEYFGTGTSPTDGNPTISGFPVWAIVLLSLAAVLHCQN